MCIKSHFLYLPSSHGTYVQYATHSGVFANNFTNILLCFQQDMFSHGFCRRILYRVCDTASVVCTIGSGFSCRWFLRSIYFGVCLLIGISSCLTFWTKPKSYDYCRLVTRSFSERLLPVYYEACRKIWVGVREKVIYDLCIVFLPVCV